MGTHLQNKTVLITGATSGIGWGLAQTFAKTGARVFINGLPNDPNGASLVNQLSQQHSRANQQHRYLAADLTDPAAIAAMMQQAANGGGVDILINNAGIQHVAPVADFPPERWQAVIDVNLSSVFHTSKAVIPTMQTRGWGRIINIASAHGLAASPMKSAYVAAKHGMVGFTKSLALEVATDGITCNAICPGYVHTPLVEQQIPTTAALHGISETEVVNDIMLRLQATKRFVTSEEIGAMTLFLCGEHSGNITGSSLSIDGGWTAQ